MAEAAVDQRPKFFCHQCSLEISPNLPDYTCPRCESGFIEEIEASHETNEHPMDTVDPSAQFAELWGRTLLDSFRVHTGQAGDEDDELSSDSEMDEDAGPASRTRSRQQAHRAFNPFMHTGTRIHLGTRQNNVQMMPQLDTIVQHVLAGLTGGAMFGGRGGGGAGGFPIAFNLGGLYGNPGDYAWGSGGLDAIITQLLNQLDGSGPPPAQKDQIDGLPTVNITQSQIDKNLQCSVCMDDFALDESVRRLPCNHHYHQDCIVPWLELHGTCPVCRKTLDGKDTSTDEASTPTIDGNTAEGSSTSGSNSQSTSTSHSSSQTRSRSNNYDPLDEYD